MKMSDHFLYIYPNSISHGLYSYLDNNYKIINDKSMSTIVFCRFRNKLSSGELKKFPNLKFIFTCTTGTDHIDRDYCLKYGVTISSLFDEKEKLSKITASCEFALILCLMACRGFHLFNKNRNSSFFETSLPPEYIKEVSESSFGIIGYGRIGNYVASSLETIARNVIIYDPYIRSKKTSQVKTIKQLVECDVILISCPYNESTISLINFDSFFKHIKEDKYTALVNIARGPIVDCDDLCNALSSNENLSYYADTIDSYSTCEQEKLVYPSKYSSQIYITPHVAGSAYTAVEKADMISLERFKSLVSDGENYS